ncbi:MAG: glycerol-3-phosphate 1-O-acyltransferase PlsY [Verrucomicrobia bacterium]|nr:glycerol-3-phosphate 1-O-acyltransferase PlsY [Verrucomicrobiota bacterium]MBU4247980.1 glycerol-3-phosphate 1-O-acyltransferase PlsY [Verrucomicrobiota bacterium]MBU4291852.1 glycerol-3-phosphate 1-O-acyltransferase PlsY [Verrucomicrobiota bacterium]MBU4497402.1 glycerol-3-phosphate 1-O-acyltransferase PlsY [Verrucomicrobiota bacterium]MCG2681879.1 glycerol-3-phosphate 1-O-acyltransferase PlsY [Kiritimatiellia bacterium]
MSVVGSFIIWGILSYLLGAIPCGYLIARTRGIDIRTVGSGNIGATNVFRSVGKSWGVLTFLCDALKGFIPVGLFPILSERFFDCDGGSALAVVCACLAIAGHNWPVYLGFKGGKGIATSLGALIGIAPAAAGLGALCWIILFLATRYVSVASIFAALIVGIASWFLYLPAGLLIPLALSLLCVLAIWRHKGNIQRLWNGIEHRFKFFKGRI